MEGMNLLNIKKLDFKFKTDLLVEFHEYISNITYENQSQSKAQYCIDKSGKLEWFL